MDVWIVQEGPEYRWFLAPGTRGDGPLARGAMGCADEASCRVSAAALTEAPGEAIVCVQEHDGGWRWRLAAADGTPLAESAGSFADAPACRISALAMQRVLAERLRADAYALTGI
jgi:hypothetical protein